MLAMQQLEIACVQQPPFTPTLKPSTFALPLSVQVKSEAEGVLLTGSRRLVFRRGEGRMGVSIVVIAVILASCLSSACASSAFSSSNVGSQPPRSSSLPLPRLSSPPLPPNRGLSHHPNKTQMLLSNVRQTGTAEVIFIVAAVVVAHAPTRWK